MTGADSLGGGEIEAILRASACSGKKFFLH
jgi:hypothetical protein